MEALFKIIPKEFFVENLKRNQLGHIKLALLREVTGNMIIRSNYADETITYRLDDKRDLVEIPARKLKSKEKLLGLKICREYSVIDESLRYNVISKSEHLGNPNSILFGDSVTESNDAVGLKSRVIYDWAYSIRDVNDITGILQHNALSEGGTMWNEDKGELRQSLFQVQYIKPNTFFPHFITLENVTPELFLHLIFCVLYENRYGAQTTTLGANVKNHILGIGFGKSEPALNSFSIAKNWKTEEVNFETVTSAINTAMQANYKSNYKPANELVSLAESFWNDTANMKSLLQSAKNDCETHLKEIGIVKVKDDSKPKKNK